MQARTLQCRLFTMPRRIVTLRIHRTHLQRFEAAELLTRISNGHQYSAPQNSPSSVTEQRRNKRKSSCERCRQKKQRCLHEMVVTTGERSKKKLKHDHRHTNSEKNSSSWKTYKHNQARTISQIVSDEISQEAEEHEESVLHASEPPNDNEHTLDYSKCPDCTIGDGCYGSNCAYQLFKELSAKLFKK